MNIRITHGLNLMACLAVLATSGRGQSLEWIESKSNAFAKAKNEGKLVLLMGGNPSCGNCAYVKYTIFEMISPPIRTLIQGSCVPWYCDLTTASQQDWVAYAGDLMVSGFGLPLVCFIDPTKPDRYLNRSAGLISDPQSMYSRLLLSVNGANVTNFAGSQQVTNTVCAAKGTARFVLGVSNVWCRLNEGVWSRAAGTNAWTNLLILVRGTNLLETYAEDVAGHCSPTNRMKLIGTFSAGTAVNSLPTEVLRTAGGAGDLRLNVQAGTARTFGVQVSKDLRNWETVGVFTNSTGTIPVAIQEPGRQAKGFYRALPLP